MKTIASRDQFKPIRIEANLEMNYNRPRSIYQYSSTALRLSGQNCKFLKFLLFFNSQKRLGYKENNTKYRCLTRNPRSHSRILTSNNNQRSGSAGEDDAFCYWVNKKVYIFKLQSVEHWDWWFPVSSITSNWFGRTTRHFF